MKPIRLLACVLALFAGLTGCANQSNPAPDSEPEQTETAQADAAAAYTGQVTSIEDATVTLALGELNQLQRPEGDPDQNQTPKQGETPPDERETATAAEPGETTESEQNGPEGEETEKRDQPPEKPEGQAGESMPQDGDEEPPARPADEAGAGPTFFTENGETATFDLSEATVTVESADGAAEGSLEDIAVGDILTVEAQDGMKAQTVTIKVLDSPQGQPGGFGGSGTVNQSTAAHTIDTDEQQSGTSYTSTGDDENALRIDGATVTLDGITVDKPSGASSNTEDGDFYGMNAALLATDGANVTIRNANITSAAQDGNGVFSYGEGTVVTISDSTIATQADHSGGIQTTGGGTTYAHNLTIHTQGDSSAAIRSDRGGGTVQVEQGSYTTTGYNSPAVYSTADITVQDATLTAENSEALVIEGENAITLENCTVTGNMSDTQGASSEVNVHNVMIYQSMSGDAEVGTSAFSMTGGSLTGANGDLFHVTNTHCVLELSGVALENQDPDGYLLLVSGNDASRGWGEAGANGAQVDFTARDQQLEGEIAVDTISSLNMVLTGASNFTGAINIIENDQGGSAATDNAVVTIESGSTWTLTGNSTLTSLTNNGTIHFNGFTITLADGTVLSE